MEDKSQAQVSFFRWYTIIHWLVWLSLIAGFIWAADWLGTVGLMVAGIALVLFAPSFKELWMLLSSKDKISEFVAQQNSEFDGKFNHSESNKKTQGPNKPG